MICTVVNRWRRRRAAIANVCRMLITNCRINVKNVSTTAVAAHYKHNVDDNQQQPAHNPRDHTANHGAASTRRRCRRHFTETEEAAHRVDAEGAVDGAGVVGGALVHVLIAEPALVAVGTGAGEIGHAVQAARAEQAGPTRTRQCW